MNRWQRIGWFLVFGVVNLLQAYFTPIAKDEAYYWMYAQHLDLGFFDHPPFVAGMIWLGSSLLGGALGVRLLTTVLLTLSLSVIWMTLEAKTRESKGVFLLFLLAVAAAPIFNIYGFITTPDAPLLFFAALYLWAFKRFLKTPGWKEGLVLGAIMAGMAWSKYHGALVVLFTLIPHWRVLKEKYFYLAVGVALLLFSPHLIWQYQNDFLTFRFHLNSRAKDAMQAHNVWEYFLNSFLILNPIVLPVFLFQLFKQRKQIRLTHRGELFLFWGFLGFFALSTMKGHVEPHWIAITAIPMVILMIELSKKSEKVAKTFRLATFIALPLVILLRLGLMLPLDLPTEFHQQGATYYQTIHQTANSGKVVFANSYTHAAKYTFYTQAPAWSYNNIFYRPNQYDLWDIKDAYHNQEVFFINDWTGGFFDTLNVEQDRVYYKRIPSYQLSNDLKVETVAIEGAILSNQRSNIRIRVQNKGPNIIDMQDPLVPLSFSVIITEGRRQFYTVALITPLPEKIPPGADFELEARFTTKAPPGEYQMGIGVKPGRIPEILGSEYIPVVVE